MTILTTINNNFGGSGDRSVTIGNFANVVSGNARQSTTDTSVLYVCVDMETGNIELKDGTDQDPKWFVICQQNPAVSKWSYIEAIASVGWLIDEAQTNYKNYGLPPEDYIRDELIAVFERFGFNVLTQTEVVEDLHIGDSFDQAFDEVFFSRVQNVQINSGNAQGVQINTGRGNRTIIGNVTVHRSGKSGGQVHDGDLVGGQTITIAGDDNIV